MNATQLTLVMGGIRSGKSAFAEGLVKSLDLPTAYLATGMAIDAEMEQRIHLHRQGRPSHWVTVEEPLDLAGGLKAACDAPPGAKAGAVIIDCIDVWVANMLIEHEDESKERLESMTLGALDDLLDTAKGSAAAIIMVSAEVGLSLVAPEPLGRRFQDLLGLVNQRIAAAAGRVYLVVAGIPMEIKNPKGAG
ncbi:MAG: bifunctional adenosylcobinamide kinase/adenosylcobinamide-phosphate guanylyltransferase [Chloroflexi bacterium]|nr:bifunctional adenosylcobinamide kinase/adenosylcobinamide-phosphate guanylyltransferase [Chloroflexota bacterium]